MSESKHPSSDPAGDGSDAGSYWRANLRILAVLLGVWFVAAFILGIVAVEALNTIHIGGFPLGFWFAQQGSIIIFVLVVLAYALYMDRLEGDGNE